MKLFGLFFFLLFVNCSIVCADGVMGFWPFTDGVDGTEVSSVTNAITMGAFDGKSVRPSDTPSPLLFSAERPGMYIFANASASHSICERPQSVYFRKKDPSLTSSQSSYLVFPEITTQLAPLSAFTVEFFFKVDVSNGHSSWNTLLTMNPGQRAKISLSSAKTICFQNESQSRHDLLQVLSDDHLTNGWHHVALLYTASNHQAQLVLDYRPRGGSVAWTNGVGTVANEIRLGINQYASEGFNGWIACPRVTASALPISAFLRARNTVKEEQKGFWDFMEAQPGERVSKGLNHYEPCTLRATPYQRNATNALVYSADVPAPYLFSDTTSIQAWLSAYQSVYFKKNDPTLTSSSTAALRIQDLATHLSSQEAFTLEFFCKQDTTQGWSTWNTIFSYQYRTPHHWKMAIPFEKSFMLQNQALDSYGRGISINADVTNGWHHVAMVYTASNHTARLYVDSTPSSSGLVITNNPLTALADAWFGCTGTDNNENEGWNGWLAAPRFTARVLSPEEFLSVGYASSRKATDFYDLFYPAVHAVPGEVVSRIENVVSPVSHFASAQRADESVSPLRYSDECPGRYLYDGKSAKAPLFSSYHSFFFQKTMPTNTPSKSAVLHIADGATHLSSLQEYTVECFFKQDVSAGWSAWNSLFSTQNTKPHIWKLTVNGANSLAVQNQTLDRQIQASGAVTSGWHHAAAVYTASNHTMRLYLDYVDCMKSLVVSNTPVGNGLSAFIGASSASGTEGFNGWIAAPRITSKALTPEQFLYTASNGEPARTIFHWSFEEGIPGESLTSVQNEASTTNFFYGAVSGGGYAVQPENGGGLPVFDQVYGKATLFDGAQEVGVRTGAVRFTGATDMAFPWPGSRLSSVMPSPFWAGLKRFTCECFVKMQSLPLSSRALIMGNGFGEDYVSDWYVAVTREGKWAIANRQTDTDGNSTVLQMNVPETCALTDGGWHHLAVTYDEATLTFAFYVDYQVAATTVLKDPLPRSPKAQYDFGRGCDCGGFNGWLDEIRLSNEVLSPDAFLRLEIPKGMVIWIR